MTVQCVGCGAAVPDIDGPTHRYMTSAPACWQRYGELLNAFHARPTQISASIMCVDTYAIQHPGTPNPQAIRSVAVHLLNLYSYLVLGRPVNIPQVTFPGKALPSTKAPPLTDPFWLEPPSFAGRLTVFDVPVDGTGDAIAFAARSWAESVWDAWSAHHRQIEQWYARYATVSARTHR